MSTNYAADWQRYVEQRLAADEKPKSYFRYWVTGRGEFPFDMLRYDSAWPYDGDAAVRMAGRGDTVRGQPRSVQLASYREPTVGRWSSFGWSMSPTEFKS